MIGQGQQGNETMVWVLLVSTLLLLRGLPAADSQFGMSQQGIVRCCFIEKTHSQPARSRQAGYDTGLRGDAA